MLLTRPGAEIDQFAAFRTKWAEFVALSPLDAVATSRAADDSRGGIGHVANSK